MPNQTFDSEANLLENLRNGSIDAFGQIFKLYWKQLYITACAKGQSHDEAEEIVQNIFSTLWEKRQSLLITNLSFYLHTAVRNRIINLIRSKLNQEKYWAFYKQFLSSDNCITEDKVFYNELQGAVEEAVKLLPEKSREVFKLSRFEGKSNAEIANLLKVSEKAIEYHLTKSLRELRLHLKDYLTIILLLAIS